MVERILIHYDAEFLKNTGSELSIYAKNETPIAVLERNVSRSDIENALSTGLLQYTDSTESIVQMPSIIADVIWQKYPINYKNYKEQIFQFLHEISIGQTKESPYDSLYEHVLTMIYRFHFQVTKMKSRINKASKTAFIEWNRLLCELILYFIKLGNTHAAQNILSHLYIYENKTGTNDDLVPSLQLWEREIFKLHIEFAENNSPIETIDRAIALLQRLLKTTEQPDSSKNLTVYLSVLEKTYDFITNMIDALLLKQLMVFTKSFTADFQNIIYHTTKALEKFITHYPVKENDDIFYYYRILYHYQITYYYHTKNTFLLNIL